MGLLRACPPAMWMNTREREASRAIGGAILPHGVCSSGPPIGAHSGGNVDRCGSHAYSACSRMPYVQSLFHVKRNSAEWCSWQIGSVFHVKRDLTDSYHACHGN